MKIGELLRKYLAFVLPQEKGDMFSYLKYTLMPLGFIFLYTANLDGKEVFSGYIKPKHIWKIEITNINYNTHYERIIFIGKDTYTSYSSKDKKGDDKLFNLYLKLSSNWNDNKKLFIKFIPYYEIKDMSSKNGKSYKGVVLQIIQGEQIVYKKPDNYVKKLNSKILRIQIEKCLVILLSITYLITLFLQIQILSKNDNS